VSTPNHCDVGKSGEDLASDALERRGYAILERRYRTRHGEIDIVAMDGPVLVFVEVKTRYSSRYGSPAEAVTAQKRRQVVSMAADYLARRRPVAGGCRFDVVTVTLGAPGGPAIEVIPRAFAADE
jgi:putative endonuclease